MFGKLRPACKAMLTRNEELRIRQQAPCRAVMHLLELDPAPLNPFCCVSDLSLDFFMILGLRQRLRSSWCVGKLLRSLQDRIATGDNVRQSSFDADIGSDADPFKRRAVRKSVTHRSNRDIHTESNHLNYGFCRR